MWRKTSQITDAETGGMNDGKRRWHAGIRRSTEFTTNPHRNFVHGCILALSIYIYTASKQHINIGPISRSTGRRYASRYSRRPTFPTRNTPTLFRRRWINFSFFFRLILCVKYVVLGYFVFLFFFFFLMKSAARNHGGMRRVASKYADKNFLGLLRFCSGASANYQIQMLRVLRR